MRATTFAVAQQQNPRIAHVARNKVPLSSKATHAQRRRYAFRTQATQPTEQSISPTSLAELRSDLERAVATEDYVLAAELRDKIRELESEDPILALQKELQAAIKEERFGDAALLRDQLKELAPPPPPEPERLSTTSTKITEGVRVTVESYYVPYQSRPEQSQYLFAYRVRITNEHHPTTIKLVSRRWLITDGKERTQEVTGSGVVGEQPELGPGQTFEYQSACPLRTTTGSMKGHFECYSRVSESDSWTTSFLVEIAEFGLDAKGQRME